MPTLEDAIYEVRVSLTLKVSNEIRSPGSTDLSLELKTACASARSYGKSTEEGLRKQGWYALFDASDESSILSVLSSVAAIEDLSGYGNTLIGSGDQFPVTGTSSLNSLNVVGMDDSILECAGVVTEQPFTIFFACNINEDATLLQTSSGTLLGVSGGTLSCPGLEQPSVSGPTLIAAVFDGASSASIVNGVANTPANSDAQMGANWQIGDNAGRFDLAHFAMHTGRLPADRLNEFYSELAAKWGIAI